MVLAVEQVDGRFTLFHFPESKDGNLYKEIWFAAKSKTGARLRIEIRSPAYYDNFGNIWQSFAKEFNITPEKAFYRIDLSKLAYPKWAKDA